MDDIHEWNERIIAIIEKLKEDHPELITFLDEIPITIPDDSDPHINISILKEYYQTLLNLEKLNKIRG
ncbi:MAG: hypothetical protein ACK4V4_00485 [Sphingobacteriales bacterium]|jgi:hypothetical protein